MIRKILEVGLLKTLVFNYRYFGKNGLKLPALISRKVVLSRLAGDVKVENSSFGCIHIGFSSAGIFDYKKERAIWENSGTVWFDTKATLGQGVRISNQGDVKFGKNARVMANTSIVCHESISFGDDVLISWECLFMDTDFHKLLDASREIRNTDKPIVVGDKVWICCRTTILKGTTLGNDVVVAAGSVISGKRVDEHHCLIGPQGKVIKREINWLQ